MSKSSLTYETSPSPQFYYPWLGDKAPPTASQVNLLTEGKILIRGVWDWSGDYVAWAPLPDPDNDKYYESLSLITIERKRRREKANKLQQLKDVITKT